MNNSPGVRRVGGRGSCLTLRSQLGKERLLGVSLRKG